MQVQTKSGTLIIEPKTYSPSVPKPKTRAAENAYQTLLNLSLIEADYYVNKTVDEMQKVVDYFKWANAHRSLTSKEEFAYEEQKTL